MTTDHGLGTTTVSPAVLERLWLEAIWLQVVTEQEEPSNA